MRSRFRGEPAARGAAWVITVTALLLATACSGPEPTRANDWRGALTVGEPIPVGDYPVAAVASKDAVWVTHANEGTVIRIDPSSDEVVATIRVSDEGLAAQRPIALTDDAVWVVGPMGFEVRGRSSEGVSRYRTGGLVRIDPETNEIVARIPTGVTRGSVVAVNGDPWVANGEDGTVTGVDGETNEVIGAIDVSGEVIDGLALVRGSLWTIVGCQRSLLHLDGEGQVETCEVVSLARIDPETRAVAETVPLDLAPEAALGGLIGSDRGIWTSAFRPPDAGSTAVTPALSLLRIEVRRPFAIHEVAAGRTPMVATIADGIVWATDCLAGTIHRFDLASGGAIGEPVQVGAAAPPDIDPHGDQAFSCPTSAAFDGDTLWVVASNEDAVIPITLGGQ